MIQTSFDIRGGTSIECDGRRIHLGRKDMASLADNLYDWLLTEAIISELRASGVRNPADTASKLASSSPSLRQLISQQASIAMAALPPHGRNVDASHHQPAGKEEQDICG